MQPENQAPHTPLPLRTPSKHNHAFTKIDSLSDHQSHSPPSPSPRPLQQILFSPEPPAMGQEAPQKKWWTAEEDTRLRELVDVYGARNWRKIAAQLEGRSDVQCLHRWQKVLNPRLVKGPWTPEEDALVLRLVTTNGPRNWSYIANHLPGRIGKQCRERWHNHLNPDISKQRWTEQEDQIIIDAHRKYGNKWALIARLLPARTDNAVKNRWNSTIRRKMRMQQFQLIAGPPPTHASPSTHALPPQMEGVLPQAQQIRIGNEQVPEKYPPRLAVVVPLIQSEHLPPSRIILQSIYSMLAARDFNNLAS